MPPLRSGGSCSVNLLAAENNNERADVKEIDDAVLVHVGFELVVIGAEE